MVFKAAVIEEDKSDSSGCRAEDEEDHDGDGDDHQRPLLLVLQQRCLRPEDRLFLL